MRPFAPLFMVFAALAGCATSNGPARRGGEGPQIIAHRGASAVAPENTVAAFEEAIKQGADWFELDCQLSADGKVMVIHDSSLERTTGVKNSVSELTLSALKQLDAGVWFSPAFSGVRLPTLEEALVVAKKRVGVYVEIKSIDNDAALHDKLVAIAGAYPVRNKEMDQEMMAAIEASGTRNLELTRKTIAVIRAQRMENQVVLQSFSPVVCAIAVIEAPKIRTEFLGAEDEDDPAHWGRFVDFGNRIGVAGFNAHYKSLTEQRVKDFHRDGKTVAAWTVDEPQDLLRMKAWGVDNIITNKPAESRAVLGR